MPPNQTIAGADAFAHAAGIHQDSVLKSRETHEIMRAQEAGWNTDKLVLGKHSGRAAFKGHGTGYGFADRGRDSRVRRA